MRSSVLLPVTCAKSSGLCFCRFANAWFVGAKTVNGPLPESVEASPAFFTSETSVENCLFDAATCTIVGLGRRCRALARGGGGDRRERGDGREEYEEKRECLFI